MPQCFLRGLWYLPWGVSTWQETHDVFTKGVHMMAMIGFIMIAAGFAAVMKASGGVAALVEMLANGIGHNKPLAVLLMLVTMGIGSSFSTTTIYEPWLLHSASRRWQR